MVSTSHHTRTCYVPPELLVTSLVQSNVQEAMDDESEAASSDLVNQLDTDGSESRNQDLVSDVWTEFLKFYRHPFGFKDSIFQKSARIWLKGLNKGDVEYVSYIQVRNLPYTSYLILNFLFCWFSRFANYV